jgi:hypothetical protein
VPLAILKNSAGIKGKMYQLLKHFAMLDEFLENVVNDIGNHSLETSMNRSACSVVLVA